MNPLIFSLIIGVLIGLGAVVIYLFIPIWDKKATLITIGIVAGISLAILGQLI